MTTQKTSELTLVHCAGILLILACILLKFRVFQDQPDVGYILICIAIFIWARLGFAGDKAVIAKALGLPVEMIQQLSMRPPGATATVRIVQQPVVLMNTSAGATEPAPPPVPELPTEPNDG